MNNILLPKNINIIVVNDFAHSNGGASKVALMSAIGLADRVKNVIVFSAVGPVMEELQKKGIHTVCLEQQEILKNPNRTRAAVQGIWNAKAANAMDDLLDRFSPQNTVVHLHGWTKALSSAPIRCALKRGFKVVCTLHDYFSVCPNGGFFNYKTNKICGKRPFSPACVLTNCDSRNYPQKLWRVLRQAVQKHYGLTPEGLEHFITISDLSESVLKPYLPENANFYRVSNPIDASHQKTADVAHNSSFIFVGRIAKEKGVRCFAEAVTSLEAKGVIVGDGPCKTKLQCEFPNLRWAGWLSAEQVHREIRQARALVFPSLWYETQGLVVPEAAALGVPSIVSNACAARNTIEDGISGMLFNTGDVEDLKLKIQQMLDDPAFAAKMGNYAYERFWDNPPTLEKHVETLIDVYLQILGEN